jgi:SRSO17 transposase
MPTRARDAGVPAGWLTADEVYGQDKRLRVWCEQHGLPYGLATRTTTPWPPSTGGSAGFAR